MRKYYLASTDAKDSVDLRDYRQIIEDAVHEVLPDASVQVNIDHYTVSPTPKQGDAVKIGRTICRSDLKIHCIQIPKLFSSVEIFEPEEDTSNETSKSQRTFGHF